MTTRTATLAMLLLSTWACDSKPAKQEAASVPSVAGVTAGPTATCVSAMPVSLGVDNSGPYLQIAVVPGATVALEEQQGGAWQAMTTSERTPPAPLPGPVGWTRKDLSAHYESRYRLVATVSGCSPSAALEMVTGKKNPTGPGEVPPTPGPGPGPGPNPGPPPFSASRCTREVFTNGDGDIVTLDFGDVGASRSFRVTVTTKDPNHTGGYQTDQHQEILVVLPSTGAAWETDDIPEGATSVDTVRSTSLSGHVTVQLRHANRGTGPQSVHGACVALEGE